MSINTDHIADAFAYGMQRYGDSNWRDLAMDNDYTRSRSFVERYVIERAAHFAVGNERKDAYAAALDGYSIYEQMGLMDAAYREKGREAMQEQQAQAVAGMVQVSPYASPSVLQQQVTKLAPPNRFASIFGRRNP